MSHDKLIFASFDLQKSENKGSCMLGLPCPNCIHVKPTKQTFPCFIFMLNPFYFDRLDIWSCTLQAHSSSHTLHLTQKMFSS